MNPISQETLNHEEISSPAEIIFMAPHNYSPSQNRTLKSAVFNMCLCYPLFLQLISKCSVCKSGIHKPYTKKREFGMATLSLTPAEFPDAGSLCGIQISQVR